MEGCQPVHMSAILELVPERQSYVTTTSNGCWHPSDLEMYIYRMSHHMANGTDLFALSLLRSHWIVTGSVCNFRVMDWLLSVLTHWREPGRVSELWIGVLFPGGAEQFIQSSFCGLSGFLTNSNWRLPPRVMINHSPVLTKSGILDCHRRPRLALHESELRYKAMQQFNDNTSLWIIHNIIEFWLTLSWAAALLVCQMSVLSWSWVWK
jgi:hypothetical protein